MDNGNLIVGGTIFSGDSQKMDNIIEDVNEIKKVVADSTELDKLKATVAELKEMVTQMFYSPGMPGYYAAQEDFDATLENSKH